MRIAHFKPEHATVVAEIASLYHKDSIYRNSPFNPDGMIRSIQAQLANPMAKGWSLVDEKGKCHGGLIVTVASAYGAFYDVAMDTFYAVTPRARGRGLMLLNECIRWAKQHETVRRVLFVLVNGTPDQGRAEKVGTSWSMEV